MTAPPLTLIKSLSPRPTREDITGKRDFLVLTVSQSLPLTAIALPESESDFNSISSLSCATRRPTTRRTQTHTRFRLIETNVKAERRGK